MDWDKTLTRLEEVFADLYQSADDSRRVVDKAGLDSRKIAFSGSAINTWHAILKEAEKQGGQVESLIDIGLTEYPRNGPLLSAVENYRFKQGYLAEAQLTALTALATQAQLSGPDLDRLYWPSLPITFQRISPPDLRPILKQLANIPPQPDGSYPLLLFVERLARDTRDVTLAAKLRTWRDDIAAKLRLSQADLNDMVARIDEDDTAPIEKPKPYLLVELVPDSNNLNLSKQRKYFLSVIFWKGTTSNYWLEPNDDPVELESVPQRLNQVISDRDNAMALQAEESWPTIEFLLPYELIAEAVDQWDWQGRVRGKKLGMDFSIVLRSLDRLQDPRYWFNWRQKWSQFGSRAQGLSTDDVLWVCQLAEYEPLALYKLLAGDLDKTSLGLAFPLVSDEAHESLFWAMIEAGLPVVIWYRRQNDLDQDPQLTRERIKDYIGRHKLAKLPGHLKGLRLNAGRDPIELGNNLSLLWDDETRIPTKYTKPLTPP